MFVYFIYISSIIYGFAKSPSRNLNKTVLKKKKHILVWINNSEKTSDASRKIIQNIVSGEKKIKLKI